MDKEKETRELLKRIGYNNDSITHGELWVAREIYALAKKDFDKPVNNVVLDDVIKAKRVCPKCGSDKIIMFTSDLDMCQDCKVQIDWT